MPSAFAEDLSKSLLPFDYVLQTATQKAITVYEREVNNADKGGPALVIAADTVVVGHFGEIMEKPTSECQHVEMLRKLRDDGPHKVLTGVACIAPLETAQEPGYALETQFEETTVRFDGDGPSTPLLVATRVSWLGQLALMGPLCLQ